MGAAPGLLRGGTGTPPSRQAERSTGRGGWRQQRRSNWSRLRGQPKGVCLCRLYARRLSDSRLLAGGLGLEAG